MVGTTGAKYTLEQAKQAVSSGKYQTLIEVPENLDAEVKRYVKENLLGIVIFPNPPPPIQVLSDPGLSLAIKSQLNLGMQILVQAIERELFIKFIGHEMKKPDLKFEPSILSVKTGFVATSSKQVHPNVVQQDVPAWALFGMFLIVTPIAAAMVREKDHGVLQRIFMAPVSVLTQVMGRVSAFVLVNTIQLWLMLLVGVFILPIFGLPGLVLRHHPFLLFLTGVCASLTAVAFALFVGSWLKTAEQATVFAPFVVFILAAIGGILIPAYLLPELLQKVTVMSPMYWAHQSFLDLLARNATFPDILPNLLKMLTFFIVMMALTIYRLSVRSVNE